MSKGIVFKQSVSNVVTTYLGFGIGAINVLLLYPNFMEPQYYGLVTFLLSASTLIWPLVAFGVNNTLIKFYSSYKLQHDRNRLLTLVLILPLVLGLFLGLMGFVFSKSLLRYFSENEVVKPYFWLIFVIGIAVAYFEVFFAWSKLKLKSVFGNFMKEVFHRFCVTILLLLVYNDWIGIPEFIYLLTTVYVARTLIIKLYAFWLIPPKLVFELPSNFKSVLKYSFLIFIAASVGSVLLDLDKVMIEHYLPIEKVSVYGIAVYIASVIAVPSRAMLQITNPITAELLNNKKRDQLETLYTKSSVTLLVVSGLIFALIVTNINQLYELLPAEYQLSVGIVLLLSAIRLYDNLLGNNNSILFNSDHYRIVLMLGVMIAVLAVLFNLYFIPRLGLYGAAIASFFAFILLNTLKLWVVYRKFKMHPFTSKTIYTLLFIAAVTVGFYYLNIGINPVVNILLKSVILTGVYLLVAYQLKFSEDINAAIRRFIFW